MSSLTEKKAQRVLAKAVEGLSPEEGFLWSRIEGSLLIEDLIRLSPFEAGQTEKLIESLFQKGALLWEETRPRPSSQALSADLRQEIDTRLEKAPHQNPFEALDVSLRASAHEIKTAYLHLSRRFHPDRFFRKDLGDYKKKLDQLFTHIQRAYAKLKNEHDREALFKQIRSRQKPGQGSKEARERSPHKKLDPLFERLGKAEHYFKLGQELEKKGDYALAAEQYQTALKLNPDRPAYEKAYQGIRALVQKDDSKRKVQEARECLENHQYKEAEVLSRSALATDSENAEAHWILGRCFYEHAEGDLLLEAKEHLRRARAGMISDPRPAIWLAKTYLKLKDKDAALSELQEALRRDPANQAAHNLLKKL